MKKRKIAGYKLPPTEYIEAIAESIIPEYLPRGGRAEEKARAILALAAFSLAASIADAEDPKKLAKSRRFSRTMRRVEEEVKAWYHSNPASNGLNIKSPVPLDTRLTEIVTAARIIRDTLAANSLRPSPLGTARVMCLVGAALSDDGGHDSGYASRASKIMRALADDPCMIADVESTIAAAVAARMEISSTEEKEGEGETNGKDEREKNNTTKGYGSGQGLDPADCPLPEFDIEKFQITTIIRETLVGDLITSALLPATKDLRDYSPTGSLWEPTDAMNDIVPGLLSMDPVDATRYMSDPRSLFEEEPRVILPAEEIYTRKSRMHILLDVSGSMVTETGERIRTSLGAILHALDIAEKEQAVVSLSIFNVNHFPVFSWTTGKDVPEARMRTLGLRGRFGGGTRIWRAVIECLEGTFKPPKNSMAQHLLVITDGDAENPTDEEMSHILSLTTEKNVAIHVVLLRTMSPSYGLQEHMRYKLSLGNRRIETFDASDSLHRLAEVSGGVVRVITAKDSWA